MKNLKNIYNMKNFQRMLKTFIFTILFLSIFSFSSAQNICEGNLENNSNSNNILEKFFANNVFNKYNLCEEIKKENIEKKYSKKMEIKKEEKNLENQNEQVLSEKDLKILEKLISNKNNPNLNNKNQNNKNKNFVNNNPSNIKIATLALNQNTISENKISSQVYNSGGSSVYFSGAGAINIPAIFGGEDKKITKTIKIKILNLNFQDEYLLPSCKHVDICFKEISVPENFTTQDILKAYNISLPDGYFISDFIKPETDYFIPILNYANQVNINNATSSIFLYQEVNDRLFSIITSLDNLKGTDVITYELFDNNTSNIIYSQTFDNNFIKYLFHNFTIQLEINNIYTLNIKVENSAFPSRILLHTYTIDLTEKIPDMSIFFSDSFNAENQNIYATSALINFNDTCISDKTQDVECLTKNNYNYFLVESDGNYPTTTLGDLQNKQFTLNNLYPNTSYNFKIYASNTLGTSTNFKSLNFTTKGLLGISNFKASINKGVVLEWDCFQNFNENTNIFYFIDNDIFLLNKNNIITTGNLCSYNTNLNISEQYNFRLVEKDNIGNTLKSSEFFIFNSITEKIPDMSIFFSDSFNVENQNIYATSALINFNDTCISDKTQDVECLTKNNYNYFLVESDGNYPTTTLGDLQNKQFTLNNLYPNTSYNFKIYASNTLGTSTNFKSLNFTTKLLQDI